MSRQVPLAEVKEEEEENRDRGNHYIDPVDPSRYFCGKARKQSNYHHSHGAYVEGMDCVVCADLMKTKGYAWWWRVHQAAYPDCVRKAH